MAGLRDCWMQPYGATPRPDVESRRREPFNYFDGWQKVPAQDDIRQRLQAPMGAVLRHIVKGGPFPWDLLEGAKGVQLAEKGIESWQKRAGWMCRQSHADARRLR